MDMDNIREFIGNEEDYDLRYYKQKNEESPEALMDEMDEDQDHQDQQYDSEDEMDQDGEYDEEEMDDDMNQQLLSDQMDEMEQYDDEQEYEGEEEDEQDEESRNTSGRNVLDHAGTGSFVPPEGMEMEEMDEEGVEMDDQIQSRNIYIENQKGMHTQESTFGNPNSQQDIRLTSEQLQEYTVNKIRHSEHAFPQKNLESKLSDSGLQEEIDALSNDMMSDMNSSNMYSNLNLAQEYNSNKNSILVKNGSDDMDQLVIKNLQPQNVQNASQRTSTREHQRTSKRERESKRSRSILHDSKKASESQLQKSSSDSVAPIDDVDQEEVKEKMQNINKRLSVKVKQKNQDSKIDQQQKQETIARAKKYTGTNGINQINPTAKKFTQVCVLGANDHGQLGIEASGFLPSTKTLCFNIYIRQIACGSEHTHLVSEEGYLYSMGSNECGQLGLGFAGEMLPNVKLPTLVSDLRVKHVECGDYHSIAINKEGQAFGWGEDEYGAIGVRISSGYEPAQIKFSLKQMGARIKQISAGANHSCFLSKDGEVFACGKNDVGQLGIGFFSPKEYRPIVVRLRNNTDRITQVACGSDHTCYLTDRGQIYSSGLNDEGQLGLFNERNICWPERLEKVKEKKFTQISCGRGSNAIDEKGRFYVWGSFNNQQFNYPVVPDCIQVPFYSMSQNNSISTAIDIHSKVWAWTSSDDDENPLGLPSFPQICRALEYKHIASVSIGDNFLLAMTEEQLDKIIADQPVKQKTFKSHSIRQIPENKNQIPTKIFENKYSIKNRDLEGSYFRHQPIRQQSKSSRPTSAVIYQAKPRSKSGARRPPREKSATRQAKNIIRQGEAARIPRGKARKQQQIEELERALDVLQDIKTSQGRRKDVKQR